MLFLSIFTPVAFLPLPKILRDIDALKDMPKQNSQSFIKSNYLPSFWSGGKEYMLDSCVEAQDHLSRSVGVQSTELSISPLCRSDLLWPSLLILGYTSPTILRFTWGLYVMLAQDVTSMTIHTMVLCSPLGIGRTRSFHFHFPDNKTVSVKSSVLPKARRVMNMREIANPGAFCLHVASLFW